MDALDVRDDGIYVDATFGRGGHSRRILQRLGPGGRLIAVDRDPAAIEHGRERHAGDSRMTLVRANFAELGEVCRSEGVHGRVDGLLMDLGVSSPQLDDAGRGFSFRHDGPLDMRMDPDSGPSAAEWLAEVDESELVRVLREYGEERFARRIAAAVVAARAEAPIDTTSRLAEIVRDAVPAGAAARDRLDPATRTFQAVRIAVNDELGALDAALEEAIDVLDDGGRMVVISFHSLEDRRVKLAIRAASEAPPASRRAPVAPDFHPRLRRIGGLVRPDEEECRANPRARSARMRVAERTSREERP